MTDIKTIADDELERDLKESYEDIKVCRTALSFGVNKYSSGKSVEERINNNRYFVKVIIAEIKRRKEGNINT